MEFAWQQSRQEALYVEQESCRIFGYILWREENRLKIEAHYCGPLNSGSLVSQVLLGYFANETVAKKSVENYAAQAQSMTEKAAPSSEEKASKKLTV